MFLLLWIPGRGRSLVKAHVHPLPALEWPCDTSALSSIATWGIAKGSALPPSGVHPV